MRFADDAGVNETRILCAVALDVLRQCAADGTAVQIHESHLETAMGNARTVAINTVDVDNDLDRRMGAAAALMLIQCASLIFPDYPALPSPAAPLTRVGYLAGAASRLAEALAFQRFSPQSASNDDAPWAASALFTETVKSAADEYSQTNRAWWNASFTRLTLALGDFHRPQHELHKRLAADLEDMFADPDSDAQFQESEAETLADPGPATNPQKPPASPSAPKPRLDDVRPPRRGRLIATTAAITAVSTVAVVGAVSWAFPALPKWVSGAPTDEVITSHVLPNTTVEVQLLDKDGSRSDDNRTVSGEFPTVWAGLVPALYDTLTFQVSLSVRDPDREPDTNLQLSVNAPPPVIVKDAHVMRDATHEGEPKPELNTHTIRESTKFATEVPSLTRDAKVIYQFTVEAKANDTNNGYMCGYNGKVVDVLVRRVGGADDGRVWVATPYPIYVARGESC
ncbi:hypothetical protein ACNO8X_08990 [Mycobacterium sp. PDNC021]|uniref:hypothetical protein n=1 Tax=Mycobacterium sp. PDNC021 TaxID=3391399 RepID=UPI003AB093BC